MMRSHLIKVNYSMLKEGKQKTIFTIRTATALCVCNPLMYGDTHASIKRKAGSINNSLINNQPRSTQTLRGK